MEIFVFPTEEVATETTSKAPIPPRMAQAGNDLAQSGHDMGEAAIIFMVLAFTVLVAGMAFFVLWIKRRYCKCHCVFNACVFKCFIAFG